MLRRRRGVHDRFFRGRLVTLAEVIRFLGRFASRERPEESCVYNLRRNTASKGKQYQLLFLLRTMHRLPVPSSSGLFRPSKVNGVNSLLASVPSSRLGRTRPAPSRDPSSFRAFPRGLTCRKLQLAARMGPHSKRIARIASSRGSRERAMARRGKRPECCRARASFRVAENRSTFYVPACEGRQERVGVGGEGWEKRAKGGRKELARFFRAI